MYIFNLFDNSSIKHAAVENLKTLGVKYKLSKRRKITQDDATGKGVFKVALDQLEKSTVCLKQNQIKADVPHFLFHALSAINTNIHVEGIFRKGGSATKQKELRQQINSGLPIPETCHVIDVCNLVKLFLRELPEPLIPHSYHETMLGCLVLSGEEKQRQAILLTCLLLPRESVTVLSYLLEFLQNVAQNSPSNKMTAKNLAIVITPSLMHIDEKSKLGMNFTLNHHIMLVEMLIHSANDIGVVPTNLIEAAQSRKGRKRSASITRVFTGIRRMVGRGNSPSKNGDDSISENEAKPPQKRKSQEILPPAVTVKRRREMADTTPQMCRMRGYSLPPVNSPSEDNAGVIPSESDENNKPLPMKKGRKKPGLKSSKSSSSLLVSKKKSLERKLSSITWRKRRSSMKEVPSASEPTETDKVVTIPKKEYEAILTRVTCMEKMLKIKPALETDMNESTDLAEQLQQHLQLEKTTTADGNCIANAPTATPDAVHAAYQMTVEQTEALVPQIRTDVRLRWSSEGRVARSPSQRKIGSLRRRSRELPPSKSSITRGKPNSQASGLQNPGSLKRSATASGSQEEVNWQPAVVVLASPAQLARLRCSPQKRDSVSCLRRNNIGMVQAKAKFFDSLNYSTDTESERSTQSTTERRVLSMQAEMREARSFRLPRETRQPLIKVALSSTATTALRTPRSCGRSVTRPRATPLKALPDSLSTPLGTARRSPRILARSVTFRNTP